MLFNYYDSDNSGSLDYKEFSQILLDKDTGKSEKTSQQFGQGLGYKSVVNTDANG